MSTDEQLRGAYGQALGARGAPDRARCVSPEALRDLAGRKGPEADRMATLDHAMGCPVCREEFELLRSIEIADRRGMRGAIGRIPWTRVASIAAAASVVLALTLEPGRRLWQRGDGGPMRGAGDAVTVVAPANDAALGADPATFVWRAVPGARRYTLELLTPDGAVAASRETTDTTVTLAAQPALAPGEYRWWLLAVVDDGTERRSEMRRLRIAR